MEIAKQLFDIGCIFEHVGNMSDVIKSFNNIVAEEIKYRNLEIGKEDVLEDIISTAKLIASRRKLSSEIDISHYDEIISGIKSLNQFLINENFRIEDAILSSAKVAYIASKLLKNDNTPLKVFSEDLNIEEYIIEDQAYAYLNKLRKLPGGSLFYWYQTIKLIKD
ncbi:MAG: hypothetical protein PF570_01960 [Candidatus Cloacimonetes bacterium]|nr:hypothetical protein [Candidatus Cloacimonadota bacterium]